MVVLERNKEPYHRVKCRGLVPNVALGERMKTEETEIQGTFWIFAWPQLIPWKHKIVPLLSPCGGRGWEVGDFLGIDEKGQLVAIENKVITNRQSPFKKFECHRPPSPEELESRWRSCLDHEEKFRQAHPDGLGPQWPQKSWGGGILDTSRGRLGCRFYGHIYREIIAPQIDDGTYEQLAEHFLQKYARRQKPPHYFGLYTLFGDDRVPACVDDHGLVERFGKDNVHAFAVQRSPECYFPDECEIRSYRVQVRES
jgi:hypothetical protein